MEFGDFPAGAALIKKSLKSPKPEIKQAAATLQEYVSAKIDEAVAAAKTKAESGDPWQAYSAYHEIAVQFEGYDLPDEVTTQIKQLATDEQVKKQQALLKQLQSAKKSLGSTSRSARTGALNRLKKLAEDAPDSDAGKEAAQLLQQLGEM